MASSRWFFGLIALFCALGASAARGDVIGYDRVLASVTLSFDDSGSTDRAVLVDNLDGGADLYLYRSIEDVRPDVAATPAFVKKAAAWSANAWGARPSLDTNAKASLLLKSQNEAVGRSRWRQTLTIVYRNHEFLVAGVSYGAYDSLDPKAGGNCDLNFLSGRGTRNGKPVTIKALTLKLADWSDESLPKECRF